MIYALIWLCLSLPLGLLIGRWLHHCDKRG